MKKIKNRGVSKSKNSQWKQQNGLCHYCKKMMLPPLYAKNRTSHHPLQPTWDHAIPRSQGGSCARENLRLCCAECNHTKGDRTEEEYFELLAMGKEITQRRNRYRSRSWAKHDAANKIRNNCNNYPHTGFHSIEYWGCGFLQSTWFILCTSDYQEKISEEERPVVIYDI